MIRKNNKFNYTIELKKRNQAYRYAKYFQKNIENEEIKWKLILISAETQIEAIEILANLKINGENMGRMKFGMRHDSDAGINITNKVHKKILEYAKIGQEHEKDKEKHLL